MICEIEMKRVARRQLRGSNKEHGVGDRNKEILNLN